MGVIRKTKSMELLLTEFNNSSGAISVINLIEKLGTEMNKTTIYRGLDKLEDDGVLHSFLGLKGIKWYAKCNGCSKTSHVDHHPHFQCVSCGKVDCIQLEIDIPKIPSRKIYSSHIMIKGECESCLKAI